MEGVFMGWFCYEVNIKDDDFSWTEFVYSAFTIATSLLQVVSAVVQVWSVLEIRKFLSQTGTTVEQINVKTLLLHSATFSLFAASVIVCLGFSIFSVFFEGNQKA